MKENLHNSSEIVNTIAWKFSLQNHRKNWKKILLIEQRKKFFIIQVTQFKKTLENPKKNEEKFCLKNYKKLNS